MYEAGNALVEAREEAELLRLHLELAQQEEAAAKRALAEAQAALAAALAAPDDDIDDGAQSAAQDDVSKFSLLVATLGLEVAHENAIC